MRRAPYRGGRITAGTLVLWVCAGYALWIIVWCAIGALAYAWGIIP